MESDWALALPGFACAALPQRHWRPLPANGGYAEDDYMEDDDYVKDLLLLLLLILLKT